LQQYTQPLTKKSQLPSDFIFRLPVFVNPLFILILEQLPMFGSSIKTINLVESVLQMKFFCFLQVLVFSFIIRKNVFNLCDMLRSWLLC